MGFRRGADRHSAVGVVLPCRRRSTDGGQRQQRRRARSRLGRVGSRAPRARCAQWCRSAPICRDRIRWLTRAAGTEQRLGFADDIFRLARPASARHFSSVFTTEVLGILSYYSPSPSRYVSTSTILKFPISIIYYHKCQGKGWWPFCFQS